MRNLKNIFAAAALMSVLVLGTTIANAGIIIRGRTDGGDDFTKTAAACESTSKQDGIIIRGDGIIIRGFAGIIIRGFTGIIIRGIIDDTTSTCQK